MRHKVFGRKLGRPSDQRVALRRNLITELFAHGRIRTTEAKAKAVRGEAEKIITLAKRGVKAGEAKAVNARRLAAARLNDSEALKKLFDDYAPRYAERPGGYTRIVRLGQRLGDAAKMVLLELVEE
ncbi:MAG: 50S ribosomal protein L17 [Chloroflexi bacterium]|nr:50S ribosomal protein L17 [Chloroflexota bacterium]MBI3762333.1 50S ribosomal protein L17 [Chloroflexota bacterium]